jgi:hypothetical protein
MLSETSTITVGEIGGVIRPVNAPPVIRLSLRRMKSSAPEKLVVGKFNLEPEATPSAPSGGPVV